MNKYIYFIVAIVIIVIIVVGILYKKNKNETQLIENTEGQETSHTEESLTGIYHAEILIKDYGTITVELDGDIAPVTVTNFVQLANQGFYDGLTFHRIINGFMMQGGDPEGNGNGGSGKNIKGEFKANGVENNISHIRGVISMARAKAYNSASSQFFIVQQDSTYLDGQYAGFGKVLSGMEIIDKICEETPVIDNNGTVLKENQPIIEKITVRKVEI